MTVSAVPGFTAALVAAFTAAAPSGVVVIDGPAYDPPYQFLAVGWDRTDAAATLVSRVPSTAGFAEAEAIDVSCMLSFAYDDNEVTDVRTALFTAFYALADAIAADRTLGGSVMTTRIGAYDLTSTLTEAGAVADLRFTVSARSYDLT